MRVALTGVPGTGKTTVAAALAQRHGWHVVALNDFARDHGLLGEADAERGSRVIDMDDLAEALNAEYATVLPALLVEGHFAHEMDVDLAVLLRCDPAVLVERLRARGWPEAKVRENVEAEALDVLAQEVVEARDAAGVEAWELDVTRLSVEEAADQVYAIAEGRPQALMGRDVGRTSWTLESLPWF